MEATDGYKVFFELDSGMRPQKKGRRSGPPNPFGGARERREMNHCSLLDLTLEHSGSVPVGAVVAGVTQPILQRRSTAAVGHCLLEQREAGR